MIESPFHHRAWFDETEYQKLGELSILWSQIEHLIGNSLKAMLRLTDEEAIAVVFPLALERRLQHLARLAEINPPNDEARIALDELKKIMNGIQYVRNNVIHAVISDDPDKGILLRLHSKDRSLAKEQVFACEELSNYAAHVALALRLALGIPGDPDARHALPDRPKIPEFLRELIPTRT